MKRVKWLVISAALGLITASALAGASPADRSISPVMTIEEDPDASVSVGESQLVRNNNGISMSYRATGLEPGTVATIWWVIFNNPGACDGACGEADLPNPEVDASVFYAAGHVIGGSGRANYGASLPVDRLTVDPDPDANQLIAGDGILKDSRDAEVHLVLRTHGPKIPSLVNHMVNTFDAGCTTAPEHLEGPNTCENLQASVHMP